MTIPENPSEPAETTAQLRIQIIELQNQLSDLSPTAVSRQAELVFAEVHKKIITFFTMWAVPFTTIIIILGWNAWDARKIGDDLRATISSAQTDTKNTLTQLDSLKSDVSKASQDVKGLEATLKDQGPIVDKIVADVKSDVEKLVEGRLEAAPRASGGDSLPAVPEGAPLGWVFYGWASDNGLQQHYFQNQTGSEANPKAGDVILAIGSVNIRQGPNTFGPAGDIINTTSVGVVAPGTKLKVLDFKNVSSLLWVKVAKAG